jgi:hypothetical protein
MEIHPYNPNNEFYIYDYKESCKKLLNQLDKSKTNEDNGEDERNKENEDAKSREVEDEERQSF